MMIAQAEADGGRVDMHRFGDGACFVAEGLSASLCGTQAISPPNTIAYKEADPSSGLWFVLLADHSKGSVRLYAVRQSVLPWNVPENTRVADAMVCTGSVDISTSSATGPGPLVKPVPREPLISHWRRRVAVVGCAALSPSRPYAPDVAALPFDRRNRSGVANRVPAQADRFEKSCPGDGIAGAALP